MSEKIRLNKYLAGSGVGARRKCEELVFAGKVSVNGKRTLLPQTMIDLEKDKVTLLGRLLQFEEKKVYYILNKPSGYLCTSLKTSNRGKIVVDIFKDVPMRLFTVGRLDKETTGLIIVTNDGQFANKVIHPSSNITKEYIAKTDKEITPEHLYTISEGALVEGTFVKPVKVTKIRRGTVKVAVTEGKKREVRVLLEAAGLEVRELCRIRIGNLLLGQLLPGQWRTLSERERELVFE